MATLNQVQDELVAQVKLALAQLATSVAPVNSVVYTGHPVPQELQKDLRAKIVNVSINVSPTSGKRQTSIINKQNEIVNDPIINLTSTISATQLQGATVSTQATGTITLSGSVNAGLNLMAVVGQNYIPYHPVTNIPLSQVATELAAAINANVGAAALVTAASVGTNVVLTSVAVGIASNAIEFDLRVGGTGSIVRKTRTQKDEFQIHIWGYNDDVRGQVADAIDSYLEDVNFLQPTGEPPCRLLYTHRMQTDAENSLGIYRRVLYYTVEYSMTKSTQAYTVLQPSVSVLPNQ